MKLPILPLLVPLAIALDQWVKWMVETSLNYEELVPMLPFLGLYRTWNQGIAFSMLSGLPDQALLVMTAMIICFVLYLWRRASVDQIAARVGYALIIGGAFGNLIDRTLFGHVVDYVLFHTPVWSFAVFNLADVFISLGAVLILVQEFVDWRKSQKNGTIA
jgi:signal peptidase II